MTRRAPFPAPTPPAIGYLRVSTEGQARDDRASLPQQEAAIRALAKRRGFELGALFTDPGVSGGSAARPAFQALLAYCASAPRDGQDPGYVLVLNDSRWGRFENPEEATYWRVHLQRHGWLVCFAEGDDTQDALARGVLRAIHSTTASAYREQLKANVQRGVRGSAEAGFWMNKAPIGYRRREIAPDGTWGRVLEHGQRKADDLRVKLVLGPQEEQDLVRWLFTTYAGGEIGIWQLARLAAARWPAKRWSSQVVSHMLQNRTYRGEIVWCRRPHDAAERRRTPVRDVDSWVVVPDAHEALIPADLFAAVQARLLGRRRALPQRSPFLLTGLLTCAHCGDTFIAGGTSRPRRNGERTRFYLHRQGSWMPERRTAPASDCPELYMTLHQARIDAAVIEAVTQAAKTPAVQLGIRQAFDAALETARQGPTITRESLRRRRVTLEAERARLVDGVADGTLSKADARPRLERNRLELDAVDQDLQRGRFGARRVEAVAAERDRLLAIAQDLPALLPRLESHDRRRILAGWLQGARVDRAHGTLRLELRAVPALAMGGPAGPG